MDYRSLGHGWKILKIKVFPLRSTLQHWLIHWVQGLGATGRGCLMVTSLLYSVHFFSLSKVSSIQDHPLNMHQFVVFIPVFVFICLYFLFYFVICSLLCCFCFLSSCLPCLVWFYLLLVNLPSFLYKSLCVSICLCQLSQFFVCLFQTDTLPWSPLSNKSLHRICSACIICI